MVIGVLDNESIIIVEVTEFISKIRLSIPPFYYSMSMTKNETTNLYNTFVHSEVGANQGCFGSSIGDRLSNSNYSPEDITEFVYMRYCPTKRYPDVSTHWSLRPALYTENTLSFASDTASSRRSGGIIRTKSNKQTVVKSYVYRFENVITVNGEQTHYCIARSQASGNRGIIKLTECGPMTPWISQWFEIIEEADSWGKKKLATELDDANKRQVPSLCPEVDKSTCFLEEEEKEVF